MKKTTLLIITAYGKHEDNKSYCKDRNFYYFFVFWGKSPELPVRQ